MPKTSKMSNFAFFAMTASLFITVYEYPTFAQMHKSLIFLLLFCGLFWFLPVALCSAELATTPGFQAGGIFSWVGKPLGEKFGFAAIFFQWFQVTVGFVTMIYFIIGTISYIFNWPELNNNPVLKFLAVAIIIWVLTFVQFAGTKRTAKIAQAGFSLGILVPVFIMLVLAIVYFAKGNKISTEFAESKFIPDGKSFATLSTFILAYIGVEASAPNIPKLANPKSDYPKILILLVIIGIVVSTIGGSVVSVVLNGTISANEGVMDAIQQMVSPGKMSLPVIVLGLLIVFGIVAQISSWLVSPTAGLQYVAKQHLLPAKFEKDNENGVPTSILIMQAIVVTIWGAILTFGAGGSGGNIAFQTAISLTVLIYLVAYVLLFISYFKVIFGKNQQKASYQMPGGKAVKVIVAGIGLVVSLIAIATAFIVPSSIASQDAKAYLLTLIICFVVTVALPFIIYRIFKKNQLAKQKKSS